MTGSFGNRKEKSTTSSETHMHDITISEPSSQSSPPHLKNNGGFPILWLEVNSLGGCSVQRCFLSQLCNSKPKPLATSSPRCTIVDLSLAKALCSLAHWLPRQGHDNVGRGLGSSAPCMRPAISFHTRPTTFVRLDQTRWNLSKARSYPGCPKWAPLFHHQIEHGATGRGFH